MKQLFAFFLTLLLSVTATAQTFPKKYVDSLTAIALSRKSTHPLLLNRDSVLQLMWQAPLPADRIAMFYDIVAYSDELTPERSLYYHQLILKGAQNKGDKVMEATVMAELGFIISRNGNTAEGLKMIYKSLEKAEATTNAQAIGIAYNNLGNCYPNNPKLAREYMTKALAYAREGNDYTFASFDLANLGGMFMRAGKRDSALAYYLEGYKIAVERNLEAAMPGGLLNLSGLDDAANRLQYYKQAALMPFAIRNGEMKGHIARSNAVYYIKKKDQDSAFYFTSEVYNIARSANLTAQLSALALMGQYYKAFPNTDSTLLYLERYYTLKDSLYGDKVVEQAQGMAYNDMQRQKEITTQKAEFQNRMILYFISAVAVFLMGLAFIFWRNKRKEQHAKKLLQQQKNQLEQTLDRLTTTQQQLIQSEKMASLGELTAGIAHEIQNPLNFVNNFSEVSMELIEEVKSEKLKAQSERDEQLETELLNDIAQNLEKIAHHGKRADFIVKGMLQHSRTSTGEKQPTNLNMLADEFLKLSYHGLRAKDKSFNAELVTNFDEGLPKIDVVQQDIGRVLLNLFNNAFYAVQEKNKEQTCLPVRQGIKNKDTTFKPTVEVSTKLYLPPSGDRMIIISVKDNGNGIPDAIKEKIMQPFFTTKPTGEGTGLGLSLSYDIVKAHGGDLKLETKEGEGSVFIIALPV